MNGSTNMLPHFSWIGHEEKTAIFIDSANLHEAVRQHNYFINWSWLSRYFNAETRLLGINYFAAASVDSPHGASVRKFHDFLAFNGISLHLKEGVEHHLEDGSVKLKANVDIEIALSMIELVDKADHMILFSGDGDFVPLVRWLRARGVVVTVCSTFNNGVYNKDSVALCSKLLRQSCSHFVDLRNMIGTLLQTERKETVNAQA